MNIRFAANRAALKLQKNSPQILFGVGIVGSVATVVLACRATLKAAKVHEAHKADVVSTNNMLEQGRVNEAEHRQQVVQVWKGTSVQYVKLYGPAFILGVTSIVCLTKSHNILRQRNARLAIAYTGLDKFVRDYRGRVVNELGEEKDTEFAHGVEEKEIVEYDKKGNPVVKNIKRAPANASTIYGRWFDEANRHWDKDPGYNHNFLDNQQKWMNLELKKKGHVFLNEVYDILGMERSAVGQEIGWVYDSEVGDGYIDFGFNRYPEFVAGYERTVFLDFNVDGPILHILESN